MSRRTPSPATVLSLLALFVALGGTTYAAATIGSADIRRGAVRSSDIRTGAVKSIDIRNGTIRSGDVRDGTLRARDFRAGELLAGPSGPSGPSGPAGPAGTQGPRGPSTGFGAVSSGDAVAIGSDFTEVVAVALPAGSFVISGAGNVNNNEASQQTAECRLSLGDAVLAETGSFRLASNGQLDREIVALTAAASTAAPATARVECRQGGEANVFDAQITAVQVDGLG